VAAPWLFSPPLALTVLRSVAELKQLVEKPEVVEAWDVTAQDPRLLVHLKGLMLARAV
jgi:hypothetical protein